MLTILTVLQGHSQISDTSKVIISKKDALRVLAKGYEAKALEQQRDLLLIANDTLKARISIKDMIILNLSGKVSDYKSIVSDKDAIIQAQKDQRTILQNQVDQKNIELKKQRRKTRFTAFIGLLTTGLVTYLFISK